VRLTNACIIIIIIITVIIIITTGLSCSVSEVSGDTGRKTQMFRTLLVFNPGVEGVVVHWKVNESVRGRQKTQRPLGGGEYATLALVLTSDRTTAENKQHKNN